MKKGLVQAYYGDGKGKTTAVIGFRAAGAGFEVLFQQFLKTNDSSELNELKNIRKIKVGDAPAVLPFYFMMKDKEKEQYNRYAASLLKNAAASAEDFDLIVLDEVLDCIALGIIPESSLIEFIVSRPPGVELALTGHSIGDKLIGHCDYVTEVRAIKHPFEKGQAARRGIEF